MVFLSKLSARIVVSIPSGSFSKLGLVVRETNRPTFVNSVTKNIHRILSLYLQKHWFYFKLQLDQVVHPPRQRQLVKVHEFC